MAHALAKAVLASVAFGGAAMAQGDTARAVEPAPHAVELLKRVLSARNPGISDPEAAAMVKKALTPSMQDPQQISVTAYAGETFSPPDGFPASRIEPFSPAAICAPPKVYRPWTRWWWPGNYVDAGDLVEQLRAMDRRGMGNVEIQPLAFGLSTVRNPDVLAGVKQFDTPQYYRNLDAVLDAAESLGLQVDLNNLSGFPGGGPHVLLKDGVQTLVYADVEVTGGAPVELVLPKPGPNIASYFNVLMELSTFGAFADFAAGDETLISVVAGRIITGTRSADPLDGSDQLTLDPKSITVLTSQVRNGVLRWTAPEGRWVVVATYVMPDGEEPLVAASTPAGYVVDHLRRDTVLGHYNYAFGSRTGLPAHFGKGLRAIFNDSFEFRADRLATASILEEFRKRRGYDLEPYLPIIHRAGGDNMWFNMNRASAPRPDFRFGENDERVLYDYNLTISDLVRETFFDATAQWGRARGLLTRTQVEGLDIDLLRGYGAVDIPESDSIVGGGGEYFLRLAAAGAALYGRQTVSIEAFTFSDKDYRVFPQRFKAAADKYFAAGVNQIVYHGSAYQIRRWEGDPFGQTGWAPFSSPAHGINYASNLSSADALWNDYGPLNLYLTRGQHLLHAGTPAWDALIVYPFLGFEGDPEDRWTDREPLIHGELPGTDPAGMTSVRRESPFTSLSPPRQTDSRSLWLIELKPLTSELAKAGLAWTWVNGDAIRAGRPAAKRFVAASGRSFGAIILPNVDAMAPEEIEQLVQLARSGVPIVLFGRLPQRQPGYRDASVNDLRVRQAVQALMAAGAYRVAAQQPARVAEHVLSKASLEVRYSAPETLVRVSRTLPASRAVHFFSNLADRPAGTRVHLRSALPAYWFDAFTGQTAPAEPASDDSLELTLAPYESRFLLVGLDRPAGLIATDAQLLSPHMEVLGTIEPWRIRVEGGAAPFEREAFTLSDWRAIPELRYAAGPARYSASLSVPETTPDDAYVLDLGDLVGAATVIVNGQSAGQATSSPFRVDITRLVRAGRNRIDIELRIPGHNSFLKRAASGDTRYAQFANEASQDAVMRAGLIGPVRLLRVANMSALSAHQRCAPAAGETP